MLKNYIKTAYRSLMKNKGFTLINVLGLALGLATCMLIVFYVYDEIGYDTYNVKADRIYRVNNDIKFAGNTNSYAVVPAPVAAALKNIFRISSKLPGFGPRAVSRYEKVIKIYRRAWWFMLTRLFLAFLHCP
jgi:hypothetical protein